jgi:hypothetical protein
MTEPQEKPAPDHHRIQLAPRDPKFPVSGRNAVLMLDGQPLVGVQRLSIELLAGEGLALATIEMLADVRVDGVVDIKKNVKKAAKKP